MDEHWVTMTQAAEELNVPVAQISRLAKRGDIKSENDAVNRRVKLVDLEEVKRIFAQSKYYSQDGR